MQIVMEPTSTGWRARPWTEVVEGATPEEVRARLAALVAEYHRRGATFLPVEDEATTVGESAAWRRLEGAWRNDPLVDFWEEAVRARRQALEDDPNA